MQSRRSFFGRVGRYTGGGADQQENRLTEMLAVVLEEIPGLPLRLAKWWLEREPNNALAEFGEDAPTFELLAELGAPHCEVKTQWRLDGGSIPDLVLKFEDSRNARSRVVIGVEVKLGAGLTGNQIEEYLRAPQLDSVVLLAPRTGLQAIGSEARGVPGRAWEGVGEFLTGVETESDREKWLIDQFVIYLREKRLMPPPRIEERHLTALAWTSEAEDGLYELITTLDETKLVSKWDRGQSKNVTATGVDSYLHWKLPETMSSSRQDAWLEFKASSASIPEADLVNESGEGLLLIAGLTADSAVTIDEVSRELGELPEDFFRFKEGSKHRLMRVSTPRAVLGDGDLSGQAQEVADWVTEAFTVIAPSG